MTTTQLTIDADRIRFAVSDVSAPSLRQCDCGRPPIVEILPSGRVEIVDGYHRIAGMIASGETSIVCITCDDADLLAAAANAEDVAAQSAALTAIYGD